MGAKNSCFSKQIEKSYPSHSTSPQLRANRIYTSSQQTNDNFNNCTQNELELEIHQSNSLKNDENNANNNNNNNNNNNLSKNIIINNNKVRNSVKINNNMLNINNINCVNNNNVNDNNNNTCFIDDNILSSGSVPSPENIKINVDKYQNKFDNNEMVYIDDEYLADNASPIETGKIEKQLDIINDEFDDNYDNENDLENDWESQQNYIKKNKEYENEMFEKITNNETPSNIIENIAIKQQTINNDINISRGVAIFNNNNLINISSNLQISNINTNNTNLSINKTLSITSYTESLTHISAYSETNKNSIINNNSGILIKQPNTPTIIGINSNILNINSNNKQSCTMLIHLDKYNKGTIFEDEKNCSDIDCKNDINNVNDDDYNLQECYSIDSTLKDEDGFVVLDDDEYNNIDINDLLKDDDNNDDIESSKSLSTSSDINPNNELPKLRHPIDAITNLQSASHTKILQNALKIN